MIVPLLLCLCRPQIITLETSAMGAGAVVERVGEATGQALAVGPDQAREVLFIKVTEVDADELLARIARVTYGKWVDRDGVATLVDDARARADGEARERAKKLAEFELVLKVAETRQMVDKSWGDGELTKEELEVAQLRLDEDWKQSKALVKLIRKAGMDRLTSLRAGDRLAFSDRPLPSQIGLNGDWAPFYKLIADWKRADIFRNDREYEIPSYGIGFAEIAEEFTNQAKIFTGDPVKMLMVAEQYAGRDFPSLEIKAIDQNGTSEYITSLDVNPERSLDQDDKPRDSGEKKRFLKLTEEDFEMGGRDLTAKSRERVLAAYVDPSKDVLDLIGGTLLRRMSEAAEVDVVADVPDEFAYFKRWLAQDIDNPSSYENLLKIVQSSIPATEEGGWLLVQPKASDGPNERMDRPLLAELARGAVDGVPRLSTRANFAFQNPLSESNAVFEILSDALIRYSGWPIFEDSGLLIVWGALTDAQRKSLIANGTMRIGDMSPEAQKVLEWMIFREDVLLGRPVMPRLAKYDAISQTLLSTVFEEARGGVPRGEVTEALPRGLPQDGIISLESRTEPGFLYFDADPFNYGVLSSLEIAMDQDDRTQGPAYFREASYVTFTSRAQVGKIDSYLLTLRLTPQTEVQGWVHDVDIPKGAPVVDPRSLTGDLAATLDRARAEVAAYKAYQSYRWSMLDQEDSQKPPP